MNTETLAPLQTLADKAKALLDAGHRKAVGVWRKTDGSLEKKYIRLGRGQGEILVMQYGRKRWGTPISHFNDLVEVKAIATNPDRKAKTFERQLKRAIAMLEVSGLWPEILATLKLGIEIGHDRLQEVHKAYKAVSDLDLAEIKEGPLSWDERCVKQTATVKSMEPRLIKKDSKGFDYVDTELWNICMPLRIKKMRFYRGSDWQLDQIAAALAKKEAFQCRGRTGYDVSFSYNPEEKKAWYSEEFKGCGNGHYYLAVNGTHAIFCEDD